MKKVGATSRHCSASLPASGSILCLSTSAQRTLQRSPYAVAPSVQAAPAVPDGWTIERADKKPFRHIKIKVPNGAVTFASNIGMNPESILCMLADAMLATATAVQAAQGAALTDIAAERKRQAEAKGWDQGHDDEHTGCELSYAAACYAVGYPDPRYWPRDWYFKEGDVRRKLIKAGALIVAEIERLDRAAAPKEP